MHPDGIGQNTRTGHTDLRTDKPTDGIFFSFFRVLRHTKHGHSSTGFFFCNRVIAILYLFTYFVRDKEVKEKARLIGAGEL